MDKKAEFVAKKIESGEYFSDAMGWFHAKFTTPRTEAAWLFIIAVIAALAFLVGISAFNRIFPLSPGVNYITSRPVVKNDHMSIKSILEYRGQSADAAIIKYLLKSYVPAREEYIEDRLDRDFKVVTAFSNQEVTNEFLNEMSLSNPENPVVVYGKQATIEIKVENVKLFDIAGNPVDDSRATKATVTYTSILTFVTDNSQEITRNEADITFQYQQIIVDQETGKVTQKPELIVTGYKTRTLQK